MQFNSNFNPLVVVRLLQGLLTLINMALYGAVARWYNTTSFANELQNAPSQVAFAIFAAVFTLGISLPFLFVAPRYFPKLAQRYPMLAIEATTMIFWFAAWAASAAFLGGLSECRGSICTCLKVGTGFGVIVWLLFIVTTTMAVRYCFGFDGGSSRVGSINKSEIKMVPSHQAWPGTTPVIGEPYNVDVMSNRV